MLIYVAMPSLKLSLPVFSLTIDMQGNNADELETRQKNGGILRSWIPPGKGRTGFIPW